MKKIVCWLAASLIYIPALFAQEPCPTVPSLDLSTGKDAVTSTLIPFSSPDPNWVITGMTPACAVIPGAVTLGQQARVCSNWGLGAGVARWISFLNAGTYAITTPMPDLAYGFTATRFFRVCQTDTFVFDFNFANDNFCTAITIDGTPIFTPQPPLPNPANYNTFTPVNVVLVLTPGVHNIEVTVHNFPIQNNNNPHGFLLSGGVASLSGNNSLIAADAPDKCECIKYECPETCYWKLDGNTISGGRNKFGTVSADDVEIITSNTDRGIFTNKGLFGWNTMAPTAYLHVNCSGHNEQGLSDVRFEKLEPGKGNILVIGKEGYVYDSRVPLERYLGDVETLMNENKELRKELQDLKSKVDLLLNQTKTGTVSELQGNSLGQNYPNPFESVTTIPYNVVTYRKQAVIIITDAQGNHILTHGIQSAGSGVVMVDIQKVPSSGVYTYSLVIDGVVADTKKMTLIR